jgi:hypothetical protein
MYKMKKSLIKTNVCVQGQTIEQRVQKLLLSNEPITDGAPTIYTDRKDGVLPDYDIRTDKMEYAIDVMGAVAKSKIAQRQKYLTGEDNGGEKPLNTSANEQ